MSAATTFEVVTPDYTGPMDLLVFLVRRRELDVTYISVGAIIGDYLMWLERCPALDLDNAGDFILLAALLLQFKATELLPGVQPEPSDVELSTRPGVSQSVDLLAFAPSVTHLAELEGGQINLFSRGVVMLSGLEEELAGEMLTDVSLSDLAQAFRDLLQELPPEPARLVQEIPYTIEGQMAFILSFLEETPRVPFERLARALDSRLALIMTFLALLELIRLRRVRVRQAEPFGPLKILRREVVPREEPAGRVKEA